jgi:hypothetical protein
MEVQLDNITWRFKNQKRNLPDATSSDRMFGEWFDGAPTAGMERRIYPGTADQVAA